MQLRQQSAQLMHLCIYGIQVLAAAWMYLQTFARRGKGMLVGTMQFAASMLFEPASTHNARSWYLDAVFSGATNRHKLIFDLQTTSRALGGYAASIQAAGSNRTCTAGRDLRGAADHIAQERPVLHQAHAYDLPQRPRALLRHVLVLNSSREMAQHQVCRCRVQQNRCYWRVKPLKSNMQQCKKCTCMHVKHALQSLRIVRLVVSRSEDATGMLNILDIRKRS